MRRGRRGVAVVVLVALAVGVGLFVAVWALGDGGTDDDAGEDDPGAAEVDTTTTPVIASVDALAAALGCAEVADDDATWVSVPGVESGGCGDGDGAVSAALHVSGSAEAQEDLVAYFASSSQPLPPGATANGCAGDTPEEARARGRYHLVVGERWVVTTFTAAVADDVAARLGGAPAELSPAPHPPAGDVPGGGVCGAG